MKNKISIFPVFLLFFLVHAAPLHAQDQPGRDKLTIEHPARLVQKGSVPFSDTTRVFSNPKFEGLRKRYSTIDGIVMIGVTDRQGNVLLKGPDNWTPPGGAVQSGEGWAEAARRIIHSQLGEPVCLDHPVLVEQLHFQKKSSSKPLFSTYILHLEASFCNGVPDLSADSSFAWFDSVPADAHPNHVGHIERYLR
ncbi:MAG: NUDIX domain-containing protein [Balneolaceae bacterium]|nr:NUDIX domain-containing protein [Balneolaceae bacterium]